MGTSYSIFLWWCILRRFNFLFFVSTYAASIFCVRIRSVELNGPPLVQTAANIFSDICYQNKDRLQAGIIVGGYDKINGGTVYNIPLGGSLHKQDFAIGGSGSTYIFGFCDANYKVGMTKEECKKFTAQGR